MMKLIDHGDWGEYRGWRLEKREHADLGYLAWFAYAPYELSDGGRAITTAAGFMWTTRGDWVFVRPITGDALQRFKTIEDCIDRFEEVRERLMTAVFSGEDDGRRGVLIPRPL